MPFSAKIPFVTGGMQRLFRLLLVMVGIAAMGIAMVVGFVMALVESLPPIEELENYNPKQVTRILDHTGRHQVGNFMEEYRQLVSLKTEIPSYLADAFIAIEDERYFNHFGIDPEAVARAVVANVKQKRFAQGFSTLTLQLPRNILPQRVSRQKSVQRKLKEIILALQIEKRYSKEQILEFYMNQVYLGNGSYGVQAAAHNYFDKHVRALTLSEAAMLAGLPQKPSVYNPWINPDTAMERRNQVLRKMHELEIISERDYIKARNDPVQPQLKRPTPTSRTAPYFVEYMRRELVSDSAFNNDDLHQRGFEIHSTLDLDLQKIVDEELPRHLADAENEWQRRKLGRLYEEDDDYRTTRLEPGQVMLGRIQSIEDDQLIVKVRDFQGPFTLPEKLPYYKPESVIKLNGLIDVVIDEVDYGRKYVGGHLYDKTHIQGAVVILDAGTGEILAMSGGDDFFDFANNGQWNRAVQSARQPGSCLKPFFYAYALQRGYTPANIILDEPIEFGDGYAPKNYENKFFGPTTLREALEHSRNVPTVIMFEELGRGSALNFVRTFDFIPENRVWALRPEAPTCLGNTNVNLLEISAAYIPFINRGIGLRPQCVKEIRDSGGVLIKRFRKVETNVISPQQAYVMTSMLKGVMTNGTGKPVYQKLAGLEGAPEMAGKTGTTNDCVDAWFIGYTPQIVLGVYVGFDRVRPMGAGMTGSHVAGPIWADIMRRIIGEKPEWVQEKAFLKPEDIVFHDIDKANGLLAGPKTPPKYIMRNVAFIKGRAPTEVSDLRLSEYDLIFSPYQ